MRPAAIFTSTSLLMSCLISPIAGAQAVSPATQARFEVATIKPIDPTPGVMHMMGTTVYPGGRVKITTIPLKGLICVAFNINYWQLKAGDGWMEKQPYDVEAKPPQTDPPIAYDVRHSNFTIADERLRGMLQALLIERFQLKFHRDIATGQVFLLERSGKAITMKPSQGQYAKMYGEGFSGDVGFAGNRWSMYNSTMPEFARFASNFLQKPVLDRTGLDGAYDLRWFVEDADPHAKGDEWVNTYHASFPLFVEAAGLKLTKSTGPIESFVIDHAEPPSQN